MTKILFDIISIQGCINGGAEFTFRLLEELIKLKNIQVIGLYDSNLSFIEREFIYYQKNLHKVINIRDFKDINSIIEQEHIDSFFIGIAQRYSNYSLENIKCKTTITIHDIGDIESYDNKISFIWKKEKRFYLKLFPKKDKKSPFDNYHTLIHFCEQSNVNIITVSDYSKNSILYYFPQLSSKNIAVLYPPMRNIPIKNNIENELDIIIDRLKREFKVECNQGKPQVNYKEAITKPTTLREVYKKQSGGRGKFADIIVTIGPKDEDYKEGDLQFVNEVKGGNIPKEFIPSVQKGFENAMKNGILGGYPMTGLKVVLTDGSFHPVDSDQLSFELAALNAYKNGCPKAGPVLMEPIMKVEVVTPEENMGDVIGDLNKRRGQVEGMEEARSGARIVKAQVPLSEMFGYVTALRTITSGRATSSMEYDHHAPLSSAIAKAVLEEVKGRADLV